jgi:hypothetical protein
MAGLWRQRCCGNREIRKASASGLCIYEDMMFAKKITARITGGVIQFDPRVKSRY